MPDSDEFDAFYRGTAQRLLRYAYGLTADSAQAQDLVQEAYARAWPRWRRLRSYEDPEAVLLGDIPLTETDGCSVDERYLVCAAPTASTPGSSPPADLTGRAAAGDIDRDGVEDVAVVLRCVAGPVGADCGRQVVAYSGEQSTLLGQVSRDPGAIGVFLVIIGTDGMVELDRFEVEPFGPSSQGWRDRYRFTGSAFDLVDSADLAHEAALDVALTVEPTELEVGPTPATVSITIHNAGPPPSSRIRVLLRSTAPLEVNIDGLSGPMGRISEAGPTYQWEAVILESPSSGESATAVLRVSLPAGQSLPPGATLRVTARPHPSAADPAPAESTIALATSG